MGLRLSCTNQSILSASQFMLCRICCCGLVLVGFNHIHDYYTCTVAIVKLPQCGDKTLKYMGKLITSLRTYITNSTKSGITNSEWILLNMLSLIINPLNCNDRLAFGLKMTMLWKPWLPRRPIFRLICVGISHLVIDHLISFMPSHGPTGKPNHDFAQFRPARTEAQTGAYISPTKIPS